MVEVRDERRAIANRDKELVEEWNSLEGALMQRLEEQGMDRASAPAGTATITETLLPQVEDWDAFYTYIDETSSWHLLQRRVATAAFRELHQSGEEVPGLSPYTKRSISLRKK